jgi:hypothetical protein
LFLTNLYFYKNIRQKEINRNINDEDFLHLYNYRNINRREIEEPLFSEDNEKYYYSFLKIFFLKENFYDTFVNDNYIKLVNYNNFISQLKKKNLIIKYQKNDSKFNIKEYVSCINLDQNILKIKKGISNNSYIIK